MQAYVYLYTHLYSIQICLCVYVCVYTYTYIYSLHYIYIYILVYVCEFVSVRGNSFILNPRRRLSPAQKFAAPACRYRFGSLFLAFSMKAALWVCYRLLSHRCAIENHPRTEQGHAKTKPKGTGYTIPSVDMLSVIAWGVCLVTQCIAQPDITERVSTGCGVTDQKT